MYTYFLSFLSDNWTPTEENLLAYISPERHAHLLRYAHPADRKLSLYTALLTRMMLLMHTPLTWKDLQFHSGSNHKPSLLTTPSIDFNFSHTRNAILCSVSLNTTVGVDVETCEKAPFEIMDTVFHPEEISYISAATDKEKQERFFRVWTQKEAYTKRNGTGLVCNLTDINTLSPSVSNSLYSFKINQYTCSVCSDLVHPPVPKIVFTQDVLQFFTLSSNAKTPIIRR